MWTVTPTAQSSLFHYSEDPAIACFTPHVPATNPASAPYVWAVEARYAALYWFPRACPRVTVWANDSEQCGRLQALFATDRERVQVAPLGEREAVRACVLYEYVLDPALFAPWPDAEGQWVSAVAVNPLRVAPVGDLEERQRAAGVDLRFSDDLAAVRSAVLASGLPFSIVRYRNYRP